MNWKYLLIIVPLFIVAELFLITKLFSMISQPSDLLVFLGVFGIGLDIFAIIKLYTLLKKHIKY
ncbi:hypothetical protein GCM10027566_20110 [Arachidicoccus ginsenosidivorans]|uniref:Uncharacterized protein n=1 Tax=Arachidicoccus ginsenosidivorans TaxID=496057 RepID=A0A5B8VP99_9BACT|nr:hypothetical protein [Arachidicoccus ginsenosidivorans]QEC73454.1 hypothetical protein FSB73_19135 [Arachidicoccus ginsenosidivorans]